MTAEAWVEMREYFPQGVTIGMEHEDPGDLVVDDPSAALTYQVTWTCTGDCATPGGTVGEVSGPQAQARLRSVQRQTVTVS